MKSPKRKIKFLERKEIDKFISNVPTKAWSDRRDRALMAVLFSTGMRIHEALALKTADVTAILAKRGTTEFSITGKGGWQRVVYFSPKAKGELIEYLDIAPEKYTAERVFPITPRAAQKMIKRHAEAQGFEKHITPHTFRHSLATDLLTRGVDVRVVQEFLGHRSISSTQVYTHVTSKTLKDTHKKLYA